MENVSLLPSQKNDVFRVIQDTDISPTEFAWADRESKYNSAKQVPALTHLPTQYSFVFDVSSSGSRRVCWRSPHNEFSTEGYAGEHDNWLSVLGTVRKWIRSVQREYSEPDLWATTSPEKSLVAPSLDELENAPFTAEEQDRISSSVKELKSFLISTGEYSVSQLKFIDSRLTHLEEASTRLGRKDWITLAMGTLTNIIVGVVLAPDSARELLRNAGMLLGWITSGIHLLQ